MFVAYRGMIWFIENFFKTHKEPRFKLANLLWEQKKRFSSLRDFRDPAYLGGDALEQYYVVGMCHYASRYGVGHRRLVCSAH